MGIYVPPSKSGPSDELVESGNQAISVIGNIFKDRYDRKQYDDFIAGPGKDYENRLREAQDLMLDEDNPDAPAQAINMMKTATNDFMDAATRYKTNPYIMDKAQRVWGGHMDAINQEFVMRINRAKEERAGATAAREEEKFQLEKGKTLAETDKLKAEAEKARRLPTDKEAQKGVLSFLSGDPQELANLPADARVDAAATNIRARINSPKDERQRDQINKGLDEEKRSMALQEVAERAGRGETFTHTDEFGDTVSEAWDPNNPEHLKAAMNLIDPAQVKERFIYKTLQGESFASGIDQDLAKQKFGVLIDPTLATPESPIKRPLREDELGKVLVGSSNWRRGRVVETKPEGEVVRPVQGVRDIVGALPKSYSELSGPVRSAIDNALEVAASRKAAGEKITPDEFLDALGESAQMSVDQIIGGSGITNEELPEGMRKNREDSDKIIAAIIDRYAPELLEKAGLEAPKRKAPTKAAAKPEEKSKPIIGSSFLEKYTPFGTVAKDLGLIKGNK